MGTVRPSLRSLARVSVLAALAMALLASPASALDINAEVKLPDAEVGTPYDFQFTGDEGCLPYYFLYSGSARVPGLIVTPDGKLSGTPTEAGTFTFWVELRDLGCTNIPGNSCPPNGLSCTQPSQGEYTLIVAPRIEITATTLPAAKAGRAYAAAITTKGGGTLAWSVTDGALPPGLSLNANTGTLSGTPTAAGSYPFTVRVSDDKRNATQQYTFVVASQLNVAPSADLPVGEVGMPLSVSIGGGGGIGPLRWSVASGSLPAGLSLAGDKGVIQGTPTAAGSYSTTVTVTDSDGEAAAVTVRLTVARRLAVTPTRVTRATVGKRYRLRLVALGGVAPAVWTLDSGSLPRGLTLTRTGTLTGVPRAAGMYRVTVRVTDKLGAVATRSIRLAVAPRA